MIRFKHLTQVARSAVLGMLLVTGSIVATPPRESIAQPQSSRTGKVFFLNQTTFPLTIRCNSFVDSDGDTRTVNGSWVVEPGKGVYLNVTSAGVETPLRASKFNYRVTTSVGSSDWSCSYIDSDGDLTSVFTKDNLATHWQVTSRTEAPKGLVETKAVRTVTRSADVYVKNLSRYPVSITGLSYVDSSGVKRSVGPGSWDFTAGESAFLNLDGRKINARRFDLSVSMNGRTSTWYIDSSDNIADGRLTFTIDNEVLAKHVTSYRPLMGGPTEAQIQNAIAKLIGAMLAQGVATSGNSQEDGLGDILVRGLAVVGRDALIESAVDDLFGSRTATERASARRVIGLVLDGRLTQADLSRTTTEDAIKAALKREAPELAGAVDVVDFLTKLKDARDKAR